MKHKVFLGVGNLDFVEEIDNKYLIKDLYFNPYNKSFKSDCSYKLNQRNLLNSLVVSQFVFTEDKITRDNLVKNKVIHFNPSIIEFVSSIDYSVVFEQYKLKFKNKHESYDSCSFGLPKIENKQDNCKFALFKYLLLRNKPKNIADKKDFHSVGNKVIEKDMLYTYFTFKADEKLWTETYKENKSASTKL